MSNEIAVVEIQGMKLQIAQDGFKKVEHYKVGDSVKVLIKEYSSYKACPGVILGFDNFPSLPTMNVAYLDNKYSSHELKMIGFNEETKDIQIAPMGDYDLAFEKADVVAQLESDISKKEEDLRGAKMRKEVFLKRFGQYFKSNA